MLTLTEKHETSYNGKESSQQQEHLHSQPTLWAMEVLLWPLVKRFHFNFNGDKETAAVDKPEWFMADILNSIQEHQQFLQKHVQPLLVAASLEQDKYLANTANSNNYVEVDSRTTGTDTVLTDLGQDATVLFGRRMVALGQERLRILISTIVGQDLLIHALAGNAL